MRLAGVLAVLDAQGMHARLEPHRALGQLVDRPLPVVDDQGVIYVHPHAVVGAGVEAVLARLEGAARGPAHRVVVRRHAGQGGGAAQAKSIAPSSRAAIWAPWSEDCQSTPSHTDRGVRVGVTVAGAVAEGVASAVARVGPGSEGVADGSGPPRSRRRR